MTWKKNRIERYSTDWIPIPKTVNGMIETMYHSMIVDWKSMPTRIRMRVMYWMNWMRMNWMTMIRSIHTR